MVWRLTGGRVRAPWMSMILHNRDIRSLVSDRAPASSLHGLGWLGALMSPFYTERDLESTLVLFSLSVRKRCCSQVWRVMFSRTYTYRGERVIYGHRVSNPSVFTQQMLSLSASR